MLAILPTTTLGIATLTHEILMVCHKLRIREIIHEFVILKRFQLKACLDSYISSDNFAAVQLNKIFSHRQGTFHDQNTIHDLLCIFACYARMLLN